MCDDLADLRAKITRKTQAMLLAKSAATGKDHSLLVREILNAWAEEEIHAAIVVQRVLRSEGMLREPEGTAGACQGTRGNP